MAVTSEQLVQSLKENPFVLAPMAGITDRVFRTLMRELGCGVVITELISAHGLEFNSPKTFKLMEFDEIQRPFGIQLFGDSPEVLGQGASICQDYGADFIDLNFGCPVPKVVKKGGGSAILKDLDRVKATFQAVRKSVSIPVTVKIRTGWDQGSRNAVDVAHIAYNEGLSWVAIHGRTRAAGYSGLADWDYIGEVKSQSKIPILGNGDLNSPSLAIQRMRQTQVDGVMIGRGCLKNPWIFWMAHRIWLEQQGVLPATSTEMPFSGSFELLFQHMRQKFELYTDERITHLQLRKFASWYSSGYPGAANFRKLLFQSANVDETMACILEYFGGLSVAEQTDTSAEAFLMGGHG